MASRKLTALPTLTDVALNDKIYIVDVSDTTESPQGTSKETTIDKINKSGSYDPTISNVSGLTTTAVTPGFYSRSGNIVTASFTIGLELAALSTDGSFNFTLPILPDANFANSRMLTGTYSVFDGLLSSVNFASIESTPSAKTGTFNIQVGIAAATVGLNIVFQYSLV